METKIIQIFTYSSINMLNTTLVPVDGHWIFRLRHVGPYEPALDFVFTLRRRSGLCVLKINISFRQHVSLRVNKYKVENIISLSKINVQKGNFVYLFNDGYAA